MAVLRVLAQDKYICGDCNANVSVKDAAKNKCPDCGTSFETVEAVDTKSLYGKKK